MADKKIVEMNDAELDKVIGGAGTTASTGSKIKITSSNGVNVRKAPGGEIIGCAQTGKTYAVKGKEGHWVKIAFGSKTGYVYNGGSGYFIFQ